MTRSILFDLDGVLVKSREAWFRTVEQAGQAFRGRPVTREEFDPTFGQGTEADAEFFGLGITAERLNAFYIEHFPTFATDVWVNPEADALLTALTAKGFSCAVVTNCVTPIAEVLLRGAKLRHHFDAIACADEAPSKPAPDLIYLACEKLSVRPAESLLVGDSRFDEAAANAAGARFVPYEFGGEQRIDHLLQLLERL